MANQKVSELSALSTRATDDLVYVVDVSASGTDRSRSLTLASLFENIDSGVVIETANGVDFTPGDDVDVDLLTVNVDGTPRLYWDESADTFVSTHSVQTPSVRVEELSADPSDPPEGQSVIWQSDGTETGSDGDLLAKVTAGGATRTYSVVGQASVYVSSVLGNDSTGTGFRDAPLATIAAGLTAVGAGGKVIVMDGEYDYQYITSTYAGTSARSTVIVAENKHKAKISGDATHHAVNMQSGANYIEVSGFEITGDLDGVKVEATNCVVENNWIHDTGGQGVLLNSGGTNSTVRKNIIEDCGASTLYHGIYNSGCDGVICEDNICRNNAGRGIQFYNASTGMTDCTIQRNLCYGNVAGVYLVGDITGGGACGHIVRDNYIELAYGSAFPTLQLVSCVSPIIKRNIFIGGRAQAPVETSCATVTYTDNIWYGAGIADFNTHGTVSTSELLTNGDFEDATGDDFADWTETTAGTSTVTDDGANAYAGDHACKLTIDSSGSNAQIVQAGVMTVGKVYTLQFRAKASASFTMLLSAPSLAMVVPTDYCFVSWTFEATSTDLTLKNASSAADKSLWLDNVSLKQAYGPTPAQVMRNTPLL